MSDEERYAIHAFIDGIIAKLRGYHFTKERRKEREKQYRTTEENLVNLNLHISK
jgi:hypothetical protein